MGWLIAARALQGVGGALIVSGSLALIQGSFHPEDRNRAGGWWAGMSGVAGAAGPILSAANFASFFAYGGLAGTSFPLPIQLRVTAGYSAWGAGLTLLPPTVLTLVLSPYGGALTTRLGARGPLVTGGAELYGGAAAGDAVGSDPSYVSDVLPVVVLTGVGVPLITPPITTAVLSAVPEGRAGIASAVSNGVARTAGLVVVAALPPLAGLPHDVAGNPAALDSGFGTSMPICAGLFLGGGLVSWIGLPGDLVDPTGCRASRPRRVDYP